MTGNANSGWPRQESPMFVLLFVAAMLAKRSLFGPQPAFARASLSFVICSFGIRVLASAPGDTVSWLSTWAFVAGLMLAMMMMIAEMHWRISTAFGRRPRR